MWPPRLVGPSGIEGHDRLCGLHVLLCLSEQQVGVRPARRYPFEFAPGQHAVQGVAALLPPHDRSPLRSSLMSIGTSARERTEVRNASPAGARHAAALTR